MRPDSRTALSAAFLLLSAASLFAAVVAGNLHVQGLLSAAAVDFSQASSVMPIPYGPDLPPSCSPGQLFVQENGPSRTLQLCSAPDAWTALGSNLQAQAEENAEPSAQKVQHVTPTAFTTITSDWVWVPTSISLPPASPLPPLNTPFANHLYSLQTSSSETREFPGFLYGSAVTSKKWKVSMKMLVQFPSASGFDANSYAMAAGFTSDTGSAATQNPPAPMIGVVKPVSSADLFAGSQNLGPDPFLNSWGTLEIESPGNGQQVFLTINGSQISFCSSGCSQNVPAKSAASTSRFLFYISSGASQNGIMYVWFSDFTMWSDSR